MIKNPPIIKKTVEQMGGRIEEVIPERGYFYIKIKGKRILTTRKFKIASNLIVGEETTKFKDLTYLLLKKHNLPTPKTVCFYRKIAKKELNKKLGSLKYPIVVKDAEGSLSIGVFPDIRSKKEAIKILKREIKKFPKLIAQEMVSGKEYRLTVLGNKVIGALRLIPPRVFGDGKNNVEELIKKKQRKTPKKTPFDANLIKLLKEQRHTLRSIPKNGEAVYLRKNSSLNEGGETEDATSSVHKKAVRICVQASKATWKYLVGIDVMCDDIAKNPKKQNFNIIEINGKPDIYLHYSPTRGKTRDVVKDIINFILKLKNIK